MGPSPIWLMSSHKGDSWTQRHTLTQVVDMKTTERCDWGEATASQREPQIVSKHQRLEESNKNSSLKASQGTWPFLMPWFQTSSFQNFRQNISVILSLLYFCTL